jgi:hypothetical protein
VELPIDPTVGDHWQLAAKPVQRAKLSGAGWSVPVSIRAILASSGDVEDQEPHGRVLGPGYVLDDDAEEWLPSWLPTAARLVSRARSCPQPTWPGCFGSAWTRRPG